MTLDAHLQQVAESVLAQAVKDYKAKAAWALAMDPSTGEILVMATAPEFNPNTPGTNRRHARNLALSAAFEPGSTMKAVTLQLLLMPKWSHQTNPLIVRMGNIS